MEAVAVPKDERTGRVYEIEGGPSVFRIVVDGEFIGEVWNCRIDGVLGRKIWYCTTGFEEPHRHLGCMPAPFKDQQEAIEYLLANPPRVVHGF